MFDHVGAGPLYSCALFICAGYNVFDIRFSTVTDRSYGYKQYEMVHCRNPTISNINGA